jgi:hypothetical protein
MTGRKSVDEVFSKETATAVRIKKDDPSGLMFARKPDQLLDQFAKIFRPLHQNYVTIIAKSQPSGRVLRPAASSCSALGTTGRYITDNVAIIQQEISRI